DAAQVPQDALWFLGIVGSVIYAVLGLATGSGLLRFPKEIDWLMLRPITGITGRDFFLYLLPAVMLSMAVPYLILAGPLLALGICEVSVGLAYCCGLAVGTLVVRR
ncbi:MAG TPA: hypothetical protein VHB77_02445, partial [Planctomycetaceae bacterium]|nr:hypothetical protein [Planctomycetaceae bacterium]